MDIEVIKESPVELELDDLVLLKNNFIAKVTGFTRNIQPRIYIFEIVDGFHSGEIIKCEIEEVKALVSIKA